MLCVAALIVFSLLGIFSATHRQLAKEALDCVFRRITFRPCNTGFKEKIKGRILSFLLNRSTLAARIFNKHFELMSWIFVILMVGSTVWVIYGGINFYLYGNCNGEQTTGFCVFDPAGSNSKVTPAETGTCSVNTGQAADPTLDNINLKEFQQINNGSNNELVFVGCYSCDYSREIYPTIKKLLAKKPNFTFIHFPIKANTYYLSKYDYCAYRENQNLFWQLNDALFNADKNKLIDEGYIKELVKNTGYDLGKIEVCVNDKNTEAEVEKQYQELESANIYGTPTVFINGEPIVGPKPYRVYSRLLK